MTQQIPIDPKAVIDIDNSDGTRTVATDVAYKRLVMVNVTFIGAPASSGADWVLVDAGLPGTADTIIATAESRFGQGARPSAIVMTHGHFDHVGALETLAARWDVPIYAHVLEHPFLDGRQSYAPADPVAGGGLFTLLAPLFPRSAINVGRWLRPLPPDGSVPGLPGWRWLHTPGHAPGHISLWREADRTIVAGDAFVTTAQESVYAVATQEPEMHGPPRFLTPDWPSAHKSVRKLAELGPATAVTGHGQPLGGPALAAALRTLADKFEDVAVPSHFRA